VRRGNNIVLRLLSRLFVALLALLALRIVFATARRANRGDDEPIDREAGRPEPLDPAKAARPPRIDRAAAEDVPYVEVEPEHVRRG
jgi:hypothetical protein